VNLRVKAMTALLGVYVSEALRTISAVWCKVHLSTSDLSGDEATVPGRFIRVSWPVAGSAATAT